MVELPKYDVELLNVLKAIGTSDVEQVGLGTPTGPDDPTVEFETVTVAEPEAPPPIPPIVTHVTSKTMFAHPETHPVILDLALLYKYGAEWLEWEPETVAIRVGKDYGSLSDLNFSKMMAMKTLHLVDSFWEQWEVFNWCAASLNALFPDFEIMQAPTAAQCMVAVDTANRVREDVHFSEEVDLFIGVAHQHDGIFVAQEPVKDIAIIDASRTTLDLEAIKRDWPSVRAAHKAPTADTAEAEQLRRMLTVFEFLVESRIRLRSQLHLVQNA